MSVRRRAIAARIERQHPMVQQRVRTVPVGSGSDAHISRLGRYLTWRQLRARRISGSLGRNERPTTELSGSGK